MLRSGAGRCSRGIRHRLPAGSAAVLVTQLLLASGGAAFAADPEVEEMMAKLGRPGDFSIAPPDVSEAAPSGWYLRADAGYVAARGAGVSYLGLPTGLDLSGSGWSAGAGVGYRLASFLRAEASLDYLALGSAQRGFVRLGSSATVALASLYWDVVTLSGFTPYLSAGAGFAIDTLDAPAALRPAGNDWQFAWSAGAGVSYAVSTAVSLDLGYRYVDLGAPAYAGGLAVSDAAAHQVRFGVRYTLN